MHYSLLKSTGNLAYLTIKALNRIRTSDIIWPDEHSDYNIFRYAKETCRICRSMEEVLQHCHNNRNKKNLRVVRMTEERDSSSARERFELAVFNANGFDVEIVPGISNINRITAASSFPLTIRGRNESFWVWDGNSAFNYRRHSRRKLCGQPVHNPTDQGGLMHRKAPHRRLGALPPLQAEQFGVARSGTHQRDAGFYWCFA